MRKYTCRECNGRAGEIIPFALPDEYQYEPHHCIFCGSTRTVEPLDTYLNERKGAVDSYERLYIG